MSILESATDPSWFEGSVVRDEKCTPLTVFHGTAHRFTRFRASDEGIFFTACCGIAAQYANFSAADHDLSPPLIVSAQLQIRRPRVLTWLEFLNGTDSAGECVGDAQWHARRGYDGLFIKGWPDADDPLFRANTFVVYSPRQIRWIGVTEIE